MGIQTAVIFHVRLNQGEKGTLKPRCFQPRTQVLARKPIQCRQPLLTTISGVFIAAMQLKLGVSFLELVPGTPFPAVLKGNGSYPKPTLNQPNEKSQENNTILVVP